ncbi:MAG: hypothetical protein QW649_05130 [Thermoplasmata archaeon]
MSNKFLLLFVICLFGLINLASSQEFYNWRNAEGYITIEDKGIIKHYIIISNGKNSEMIPTKEDPSKILSNKENIINKINKPGGQ